MKKRFWVTSLIFILSLNVHSETIEIGRATIEMPAGIWTEVANSVGETKLDNGFRSGIPTDDRIFMLMDDKRVVALLIISSSKHGVALTTNWTNKCESTKNSYASNIASSVNVLGCAKATGRLNTLIYLKIAVPKMFGALQKLESLLPPISHSLSAGVGTSNGTLLNVNLITSPSFIGNPEKPIADLPTGINPRYAAWADSLATAVKNSVYSLDGKLTIPNIEFEPKK